ncbi:MAG: ammonium transporter [Anaerolineae bacterium]
MMKHRLLSRALPVAGLLTLLVGGVAYAQGEEPTVADTVRQIDTIWLLVTAFLVFFMQAGFAMVESGFSRAKNAANLMLKNLMDFAVASILFFAIGYGLMYGTSVAGFIGSDNFFLTTFGYDADSTYNWAFFLFQLVFAGTAATIVSGAVAERFSFPAYLVYSAVLSAIIYPIAGHWQWGLGWLYELGFIDFAGSTIVHSIGGWGALAGAMLVGPRIGKFNKDGTSNVIPGHSLTLAALGVFILWFGWFGFNPGSTLFGMNPAIGYVAVTTNIAAAAGATSALILNWVRTGHPSTEMALNGVLAGLVAITAGCANVTPVGALVIGLIAGPVLVYGLIFIENVLKVDDPVGAVAVHLGNGVWGTLAVGLFAAPQVGLFTNMGEVAGLFYGGGMTQLMSQAIGVLAIGTWAFGLMLLTFYILKVTIGIRVPTQVELEGLDITEHGTISYPEFGSRVISAKPGERILMPVGDMPS